MLHTVQHARLQVAMLRTILACHAAQYEICFVQGVARVRTELTEATGIPNLCLCTSLCTCPCTCLYIQGLYDARVHIHMCLISEHMFVHLWIHMSIRKAVHMFTHKSVNLCMHMSVHMSICMPV